jgi:hypothetical protein
VKKLIYVKFSSVKKLNRAFGKKKKRERIKAEITKLKLILLFINKNIPKTKPVIKKLSFMLAAPKIRNNKRSDNLILRFLVIINKYNTNVVINCGNNWYLGPETK